MLWEPARLNTSSHPKTLLQQPLTWHNELRDFVSAHIMIAGPAGSTQELNHALLNFPIDQLQSSRYMKAGPPSFVLRCSRSLKNRTYVHVCNSDVGIQKWHNEFCRYCMLSFLISNAEMTEQSLKHRSCKDLSRLSSLISL